jgi:RNA polymerase sigma factor (sigma-70 family)
VRTAEGKSEQVEALSGTPDTREAFARLLAEMRPKLHRYCARMTGSVVDGEDVIQDALMKAIEAFPRAAAIANPEAWLFRITHNTALDFLRQRARRAAVHADEDLGMVVDPVTPITDRQIVAASLRAFMRLPVLQRSSVILMDVLGYSLQEISEITESTVPAVKAALHHGRTRLRARRRLTTFLPRSWRSPSARGSRCTSTASTPAISTRSARCSRMTCGSSSWLGPK